MGSILSTFFRRLMFLKTQVRVLVVGLSSSGKTTIVYKLKTGENINPIPTWNYIVELLDYKNMSLVLVDVGGQERMKSIWKMFFFKTEGIIFVVDSTDRQRIDEVRGLLLTILSERDLKDPAILIFANKQDLPDAMTTKEISENLKLDLFADNRQWLIQPTCATTGSGLQEGLTWLCDQMRDIVDAREQSKDNN